ncbi:MAG: 16S rRNA (cytidine(1402)-2'-O)-methyltransferase [Lachnospiraceae bacterium]|nr:16S rRNA (cytidine(1402)-2'-O)-methyltransferase [Lachnospiraceae bacterium]
MAGILYVCATPIGNLGDMTPRVVECLKNADLIAAEDTRESLRLLNRFDIHTAFCSYHEHNKYEKADTLIAGLLEGKNIALITDAGTPAISDPGEVLVRKCHEAGITVTSLPGASAVVTALSVSGLPSGRFVFEGFLPQENRDRKKIIKELSAERRTIVLYEAPHHLKKTLRELAEHLGTRELAICRELTKKHEEVLRMTLPEALDYYGTTEPRGEFVLVIAPPDGEDVLKDEKRDWEGLTLEAHVSRYLEEGMDKKAAMKKVALERGISRREVYQALLSASEEKEDSHE